MLIPLSRLNGSAIHATDGDLGKVKEAYFDDEAWAVRYLVVDTGTWLSDREVLISPYAVKPPLVSGEPIAVSLNQEQVRNSPPIDTHQPVSRRHESEYLRYYAYPDYWGGGSLWAMTSLPMLPMPLMPPVPTDDAAVAEAQRRQAELPDDDVHLRSSAHVNGYDIQASDGSIGHVKDFIFDDESWAIRYLVIDTRNWLPGGKKVLIGTHWIDSIDWAERAVCVKLTREQIKNSPEYDDDVPLQREAEQRLHDAFDRRGYWD